jgi:hypothetical protein
MAAFVSLGPTAVRCRARTAERGFGAGCAAVRETLPLALRHLLARAPRQRRARAHARSVWRTQAAEP